MAGELIQADILLEAAQQSRLLVDGDALLGPRGATEWPAGRRPGETVFERERRIEAARRELRERYGIEVH